MFAVSLEELSFYVLQSVFIMVCFLLLLNFILFTTRAFTSTSSVHRYWLYPLGNAIPFSIQLFMVITLVLTKYWISPKLFCLSEWPCHTLHPTLSARTRTGQIFSSFRVSSWYCWEGNSFWFSPLSSWAGLGYQWPAKFPINFAPVNTDALFSAFAKTFSVFPALK